MKKKEPLKDFMGNYISIGDRIIVADKTYSKTPFLRYGLLKDYEFKYFKNGNLDSIVIYYTELGRSDFTKEFLEEHNYEQRSGFMREINISKNGFVNIIKC